MWVIIAFIAGIVVGVLYGKSIAAKAVEKANQAATKLNDLNKKVQSK